MAIRTIPKHSAEDAKQMPAPVKSLWSLIPSTPPHRDVTPATMQPMTQMPMDRFANPFSSFIYVSHLLLSLWPTGLRKDSVSNALVESLVIYTMLPANQHRRLELNVSLQSLIDP